MPDLKYNLNPCLLSRHLFNFLFVFPVNLRALINFVWPAILQTIEQLLDQLILPI